MIRTIKEAYAHASDNKCCEHGVEIKIRKRSCTTIFKGERLASGSALKMCDCIVFHHNRVFLIELKSAHLNYNSIVEKFQNSYRKSICMLKSAAQRPSDVFFILVAKEYGNHYATQRLRCGFKISNKKCHIVLAGSGDRLDSVARPHLGVSFSGNDEKL